MTLKTETLDDICHIEYGTRVVRQRDGGVRYPVYGGGGPTFAIDRYNRETCLVVSRFGMSPECTRFVHGKFFLNDSGLTVTPKNGALMQRFLDYQLIRLNDTIYDLGKGAAQRNLDVGAFRRLQLFVPNLREQRRIVDFLDKAFDSIVAAKANTEQNIVKVDELFESTMSALFEDSEGCVHRTLREISLDFGRGRSRHRPRNDPRLYGGSYPFIQTGEVRNARHLIEDYSETYNDVGLAQSKLWPKGTLCITIAANIAETGILSFDACFPDSVIGVVANEAYTSAKFLEYLLQSYKNVLKARGKGSAQDNINIATFEEQRFPIPPVERQSIICERLDALSHLTRQLDNLYKKRLVALEELKSSVLHAAFNGDL